MKIKNWEAILWDCLEEMRKIPDGSIDAIITDPPYGTTACKWDSIIPFDLMWVELKRIIKPNGAIVLFGSEPFSSALRMSNIKQYKYDWIWEKERPSNFASCKYQPMRYSENMSVFYSKTCLYNPQMTIWKKNNSVWKWNRNTASEWHLPTIQKVFQNNPESSLKYPRNILHFERWVSQIHPTQKPVALIEYLIRTYTNEWETVLDFTAGSFTTAVASENTNRKWICIEKEQEYYNIWIKRISHNP